MKTLGAVAGLLLLLAVDVASAQPGVLTRFRDTVTNRFGYKRDNGVVAIKPRFTGAGVFHNSRAPVLDDRGLAFIGRDGSVIERIREDSVAPGSPRIPPPAKACAGLRCYVEQLRSPTTYGGEIMMTSGDNDHSSLWKYSSGVVAIETETTESTTITVLLPGIESDSVAKWVEIIRPGVPPSSKDGGCKYELTHGAVRGGSFMKYTFGC